jgi:hypothetical protein
VSQLLLQQLAVIQVLPDAPGHIATPGMAKAVQLQQHTTMQLSAQAAQNTRGLLLLLALPVSNVPKRRRFEIGFHVLQPAAKLVAALQLHAPMPLHLIKVPCTRAFYLLLLMLHPVQKDPCWHTC